MKKSSKSCLCVILPLLCAAVPCLGSASAGPDGSGGDELAGRAHATSHRLAELDWLAGRWAGQGLGGDVEELWSHPKAGSMVGVFRLVDGEKTGFFEFLLIEEQAGSVTLRFKHYGPGYEPWEKNAPLVFDLTDATQGRAVFESRDPKQSPARVVYGLRDDDTLGLLIESPQALGGPISFDVHYKRAN